MLKKTTIKMCIIYIIITSILIFLIRAPRDRKKVKREKARARLNISLSANPISLFALNMWRQQRDKIISGSITGTRQNEVNYTDCVYISVKECMTFKI